MAIFLSKLFLGPASRISAAAPQVPFASPVLLPAPAIGKPLDTYTLMMASLPNGRGLAKPHAAGGKRKPLAEMPEDRWARKLESFFKGIRGRIRNFFPILPSPDFSESSWHWTRRITRADGVDFKHLTHTFTLHGNRNPLTHRFLEIIRANLPSNNGGVVEVGSGDGGLAQMIRETLGVRVLETDLFASTRVSPSRLRADMTALPFKNGATPMVVSSFAAEYPEKPAWQEIHRILKPGGMLVALVHHWKGIAHRTFLDRFMLDGFIWAVRRPWIKAILPDSILLSWEMAARTSKATSEVGFLNQQEVVDLLRGIGFHPPHIQNAPLGRHRSVGWIVVAKKR